MIEPLFYAYKERTGDDGLYQVTNCGQPVPEETVAHYATLFPDTVYFVLEMIHSPMPDDDGRALHEFVPPTDPAWGDFCMLRVDDEGGEPCGWPRADHKGEPIEVDDDETFPPNAGPGAIFS